VRAAGDRANQNRFAETGVVLPLMAILVVVIVGLAAFIIDLTLLAGSREQTQHFARLAALAALEAHTKSLEDEDTDSTREEALNHAVQAALDRARVVAGVNILISDREQDSDVAQLDKDDIGAEAFLEPGVWYFENPGTNPCGAAATDYPCFKVTEDFSAPDAQVTAYRVTGQLYRQVSTTALAGAIFHRSSTPVDVHATASIVPRHGCFMVDLSGSMIGESFEVRPVTLAGPDNDQQDSPLKGRGSETSYILAAENTAAGVTSSGIDTEWTWLTSAQDRPATAAAWGAFLGKDMLTVTPDEYQRMHFRTDYRSLMTLGDKDWSALELFAEHHPEPIDGDSTYQVVENDLGVTDAGLRVHADVFRDDGTKIDAQFTYGGAEPLKTVFDGLNAAIKLLKRRRVAGDKACMIFYDERTPWPRFFKLTDKLDYLEKVTEFEPVGNIANDGASPNVTDQSQRGLLRMIRYGLLPGGLNSSKTDTYLALSEALNQLADANPSGSFSSDFVVGIGDGLMNCKRDGGAVECVDDFEHFNAARKEALDLAVDQLKERGIPLHWIHVGKKVGPHTVNQTLDASGTGRCVSQEEASVRGIQLVVPQTFAGATADEVAAAAQAAYEDKSTDDPFYEAATSVYAMTALTRGLWGPIRPKHPSCGTGNPIVCDNGGESRMPYDTECRSTSEQITDYMEKIIGENPFTIVEAY
jgi:hypothetical protein